MTKAKTKFWRKCVAVFVGLALLLGMPEVDVYAEADSYEVSYTIDRGKTWTDGSLMEAIEAGYKVSRCEIKLLRDITLNKDNWREGQVLASSIEQLIIDGQGYSLIRGNIDTLLMSVSSASSTVELWDITIDGGAIWDGNKPESRKNTGKEQSGNGQLISVNGGGTLTLERGAVLCNNVLTGEGSSGAVEVGNSGKGTLFMMDGAEIRDNAALSGAAVDIGVDGTFYLNGGKIYGNYASKDGGGGVDCRGTLYMMGGEIRNNAAAGQGGGLRVCENGRAQMSGVGGTIAENRSSRYGGGVALIGNGRLEMISCEISGNQAGAYGGGIFVNDSSTLVASGGKVTGNVSIQGAGVNLLQGEMQICGSPVITGNLSSMGGDSNLQINKGMSVQLTNPLETGASIGVTMMVEGAFTSGWSVMGAQEDPGSYFTSDKENYIVRKDDATGEAMLKSHNGHDYGTAWESDEDNHWQACVCGDIANRDAHTEDGGTVTTAPTETETGVRTYRCVTCERILRTETIPVLSAEEGKIDTEIVKGDNTPNTSVAVTEQELAELVLTDEEKELVQKGTDILICLVVEDANDSVEETDRAAVDAARGDYQVGQFLDISLLKSVNGGNPSAVSETKGKLQITIAIPDAMKNTEDTVTREFAVLRVHNGESSVLEDIGSDADAITIETDRFSTYAIIYKDTKKPVDGGDSGDSGTGDGGNGSGGGTVSGGDNNGGDGTVSGGDNNGGGGTVSGGDNGGSGSDGGDGNGGGSSDEKGDAVNNDDSKAPAPVRDREPKTGDITPLAIYATLSMIAGFSYLVLVFSSNGRGLKEEQKKKLVSQMIGWAQRGGKARRILALAAIFFLLLYYHGIARKMSLEMREVY